MAQSYLRQKTVSSPLASPTLEGNVHEKHLIVDGMQEAYINYKDR